MAQLGERLVRIEEVSGSNPLSSIADLAIRRWVGRLYLIALRNHAEVGMISLRLMASKLSCCSHRRLDRKSPVCTECAPRAPPLNSIASNN